VFHLQEVISAGRNAALVGGREPVLLHAAARRGGGDLLGRTSSFRAVIVPGAGLAVGDLVDVVIERASPVTLFGRPA
jgi:tRNA A37 methylthiotransferase MiaB